MATTTPPTAPALSTSSRSPPTTSMAPPKPKSLTTHLLSGGFSGVLSAVVLQPADLLKTRLQQAPPSTTATATLVTTIRTIASGPTPIRSLWRGTLPSTLRTGVGSALYFSTLNSTRRWLATAGGGSGGGGSSALPKLPMLLDFGAGAACRAIVGGAMMPVTVLKVRFESSMYAYTSLSAAARDVVHTQGIRGFFSGWGATAIRDAPYAGLYVLFYEQCKKSLAVVLAGRGGGRMETREATVVNLVSGAVSGALATAVTNPFDALKTRIQVDPERYRNMWHAAGIVWREAEGAGVGRWKGRALFDGLGLRMARKSVSSAAAWGLYEYLIRG